MKFLILKKKKKKKNCKTRDWKGLSPKLLHHQVLYNQSNHFLIVACHLFYLIVQTNHTCCRIGGFSFLDIPIASAFVLMPCFYQCRLEGTPLDLPIANEIYVSIVKLQNCLGKVGGSNLLWHPICKCPSIMLIFIFTLCSAGRSKRNYPHKFI